MDKVAVQLDLPVFFYTLPHYQKALLAVLLAIPMWAGTRILGYYPPHINWITFIVWIYGAIGYTYPLTWVVCVTKSVRQGRAGHMNNAFRSALFALGHMGLIAVPALIFAVIFRLYW